MNRDARFAIIMSLLVEAVTLTSIAFTQIPVYQPPPPLWVGIAAISVTFILAAAVKGCVDWVYEAKP